MAWVAQMMYNKDMKKMSMSQEFHPTTIVIPSLAFQMAPKEKTVYGVIHWLWINGQTRPSNAVLEYITGISMRGVMISKNKLRKKGLLEGNRPTMVQKKYTDGILPKCHYCGETDTSIIERDHYIPRCRGGTKIVLACRRCNSEKGAKDPEEFKKNR